MALRFFNLSNMKSSWRFVLRLHIRTCGKNKMDICTAHSMCRIYPFEGAVSLERVGEHYWTDTNHECFSHAHILVPSKMSIEFSVGTILIFARAIGPSQRAKVFAALMPMTQPHKQITINYNAVYVFGTDYTKQSTFQTKN